MLSLAPKTRQQLLENAMALAGLTLGELAEQLRIGVPTDFKKSKGWTGQLLELALGAGAGSKPQQDFAHLGIELKSLPIDEQGMPLETTYVCYAHLTKLHGITWQNCSVKNKLACVLWIPVEGIRDVVPSQRRIATPFLWRPNEHQEALMRADWEELMEIICTGHIESLTARHGQVLQVRPKAADGNALTEAVGPDGAIIKTRPRGFYLRKEFTASLLRDAFDL